MEFAVESQSPALRIFFHLKPFDCIYLQNLYSQEYLF